MMKTLWMAVFALLIAASFAAADEMKGIALKDEYLKIPFASSADGKIYDHLNVTKGTIEFWLKLEDWYDKGPYHVFYWGRRHNVTAISIGKSNSLGLAVMSNNYKAISAAIAVYRRHYDLQPGSWHHVAGCWDVEKGKELRELFLDGKRIDKIEHTNHPDRKFAGIAKLPSYLYLGTGKSGDNLITNRPPNIALSQFRISNTIRYDKEFTPSPTAAIDANTLLYFPFTENAEGTYFREGKDPGKVKAERIKVAAE